LDLERSWGTGSNPAAGLGYVLNFFHFASLEALLCTQSPSVSYLNDSVAFTYFGSLSDQSA